MYRMAWVAVLLLACEARADLIAYWNFNSFNGTATTISADQGSGTLQVTGFPDDDLHNLAGTLLNALGTDLAGASLTLENNLNNGDFITLAFSMADRTDLVLSYATRRTSTGFNSNQWSYSNDGIVFTNFGSPVVPPSTTAFGLVNLDFSSVASLANESSVFLRYSLNGASAATGNNRIDNIQLNATAMTNTMTPEPSSLVLFGLGSLGIVALKRARDRRQRVGSSRLSLP